MARRRAGVGQSAKLGLAYEEVVHLIAQDFARSYGWVERNFTIGEAMRYLRMSEYHPHPIRALVGALSRGADV